MFRKPSVGSSNLPVGSITSLFASGCERQFALPPAACSQPDWHSDRSGHSRPRAQPEERTIRRRTNQHGAIYQQKDGRWEVNSDCCQGPADRSTPGPDERRSADSNRPAGCRPRGCPSVSGRKPLLSRTLQRLLETTRRQPFHPLWTVLGTAGLRVGEALGRQWDDVDVTEGCLVAARSGIGSRPTEDAEGLTKGGSDCDCRAGRC